MTPGGKLLAAGSVVVAVTAYMAYAGAAAGWKYYLTTDECVADAAELLGQRVRVSGKVALLSRQPPRDGGRATFTLRGTVSAVQVVCSRPLPDNLSEEAEVVVEGRLAAFHRLQADKVLTRCASKYESRRTVPSASIPAALEPVRRP